MDKNKLNFHHSFGVVLLLFYFVSAINCDLCIVRAECHCLAVINYKESNQVVTSPTSKNINGFKIDDKNQNLCNVNSMQHNKTLPLVEKYELVCTYADTSNSTTYNPPNGSVQNDTFSLQFSYPCETAIIPGYSTGSVLVIIFFTILFSYLGLGICVNFFMIGARGIEMLPHLDFWKDFPALVLDGVKFIQNGCTARPSDLTAPAGAEGYDAI